MSYLCTSWSPDEDSQGDTIYDIINTVCNDITASQTIYLDRNGNLDDRGEIEDEQCLDHVARVTWEDDLDQAVRAVLAENNWAECEYCDAWLIDGSTWHITHLAEEHEVDETGERLPEHQIPAWTPRRPSVRPGIATVHSGWR